MARGIAKITDTGADILLSNQLRSASDVTGEGQATGAVAGSGATFDPALGLLTGATGRVEFNSLIGNAVLDTQGQIVMTVSTGAIAKRDNGAFTTGTEARLPDFTTLWAAASGGSTTTEARVYTTGGNMMLAQTSSSESANGLNILSANKPNQCEVCLSWDVSTVRLFVDGAIVNTWSRTAEVGKFVDFNIGDQMTADAPFAPAGAYYIRDVIISSEPVALTASPWATAGRFGDSFAVAVDDTNIPNYDGAIDVALTKAFISAGFEPPVFSAKVALSGGTLCDTANAPTNLSPLFPTIGAQNNDITFLFFGNNDQIVGTASVAEVTDGLTGTAANGAALLAQLTNESRIIILNAGSLANITTNRMASEFQRDTYVNPAIATLLSDPRVSIIDAEAVFGNNAINTNYVGYLAELSNNGSGPYGRPDQGGTAATVTPQNNLHLTGFAGSPYAGNAGLLLFGDTDLPFQIIAYENLSTTVGATLNIDVTTAWSNATTFDVEGVPVAANDVAGVISGIVAESGTRRVHVVARNDAGYSTGNFILEIKSGLPNRTEF